MKQPASLETIGQRALSSFETVQNSYDTAMLAIARGIPGDFVEAGVFAGSQAAAMALAIMDANDGPYLRKVHMFDTFLGIPQAGEHDREFLEAGHKEGLSACSVEDVIGHMDEWGIDPSILVYHVGLFAKTMPLAKLQEIAVLRLDGDLHDSTKTALECLYPVVSRGGWIIVDDFALSGARKATIDYIGGNFGPTQWRKI